VFPHYITPKEKLSRQHEGATLRKIGAKQYYVDSNTKNSKEPSSKGNPEYWNLNGQAFTALMETAINHS
jgi:hypothetical protein